MPTRLAILGGPATVPDAVHRPWPDIRPCDRDAVLAVLDRGLLSAGTALDSGAGPPEIGGLEREFAAYVGARHCLSLNTGTAALHCCTAAAGLKPGDEVILPALTFISTALAVVHQGATPVFADIDPSTYNLSPAAVADALTGRTRAIVVVHLHGLPADMDELLEVARRHDLAVIEDAAQAHGARYRGRPVGTLGDCAAFSLNVAKNLAGGEGGLFVTDDPQLDLIARRLTNFGEDMPPLNHGGRYYWSHGIGWNYRNQELAAALARSQLARLDEYNATARANAAALSATLDEIPGIEPPRVPSDRESTFHLYRVRLDADALGWDGPTTDLRDRVIAALRAEGVPAATWQHVPLPAHPAFRRGQLAPWHPRLERVPLRPWDPAATPATVEVLADSFVIGSGTAPLRVQPGALMPYYGAATAKVLSQVHCLPAVEMPAHLPDPELAEARPLA